MSQLPIDGSIEPVDPILPGDEPITEENALTILIDILSQRPVWEKEPRVKICCKVIGAVIIKQNTKIENALAALNAES
jgi:hypothetical protein